MQCCRNQTSHFTVNEHFSVVLQFHAANIVRYLHSIFDGSKHHETLVFSMSLCGTECWNNYVKQSNSFASGEETKEEKEEEKEEKREKELLQNNPLFERLSLLINYK